MWKESPQYGDLVKDCTACIESLYPAGPLHQEVRQEFCERIALGKNNTPRLLYTTAAKLGVEIDQNPSQETLRILAMAMEMFDDITDGDHASTQRAHHNSFDEGRNAVVSLVNLAEIDCTILEHPSLSSDLKVTVQTLIQRTKVQSGRGQLADILELQKAPGQTWIEWYTQTCCLKTNALLRLPLVLAAVVADSPTEVRDSLSQYGYNMGIAHQIGDDIEDGIETGTSVLSYPLAHLLDTAPAEEILAQLRPGKWNQETVDILSQQCQQRFEDMQLTARRTIARLRTEVTPPVALEECEMLFDVAEKRVEKPHASLTGTSS